MAKRLLALCRQAPYGNALAREGLEAVLAAAAMDQAADLLFLGDGVFQLLDDQRAEAIEQKNLRRNLQALPIFGVETVHICERSLLERGIDAGQLQIPGAGLKLIADTSRFIAGYDSVLSF
ncbi:sulfurtransferase complex subunit TusC [Microbulbifer rhizosphaerae]|uniref:tRNA 2-thiouridine synthesizing protein C n=1 Tax=Microbulbifer rhizosphaerae TaxID=1562603 RepID=A0A7W4WA29_9GAMM|nr:sulfurtransferase complex subunit TusC [Microbulbifer rhizosphaerae]MBB3059962.1 tRNA 2-thiouridine synthesizing protein C [Microbulbifer rhizosphaerae]